MLKVMIVDDEFMLLRGIRKLIDWHSLDLEVVNTAQNPVLALNYLMQNPVDILLSDMNMPEMDGPEFLAKVKEYQPALELIVVSGYADFAYVKAGLQHHAINYLTKPIDPDELIDALNTAKQHITARQQENENASLAAQTQARSLVTAPTADHEALATELGLNFTDPQTPVRLVAVLNPLPPRVLTRYLDKVPSIHGFFREDQDFILLFQGTDATLSTFIEESPQRVGATQRPMVIGPAVTGLAKLATAYAQLKAEIARQYFFETASGLRVLVPTRQPNLPSYEAIQKTSEGLTPATFNQWLGQQFTMLQNANASVGLTRQWALLVLMVMSEKVPAIADKADAVAAINQAETVTVLHDLLVAIAQQALATTTQQYSHNVALMRDLVQAHYDEPLTLGAVADDLHMNAVYLGQLFKQETGRSFSQYLNDARLGAAMGLLRNTGRDVNEIALATGYQNPSYFYKLFKQQTSMSPREYRAAAGR